jgi:hypothetical protein
VIVVSGDIYLKLVVKALAEYDETYWKDARRSICETFTYHCFIMNNLLSALTSVNNGAYEAHDGTFRW